MNLHVKLAIGTGAIAVACSKMLSNGAGSLALSFVVNAFPSGRCWTHHWQQSELQAGRPIGITKRCSSCPRVFGRARPDRTGESWKICCRRASARAGQGHEVCSNMF